MQEFVLLFHHVGAGNQTWVFRPGNKPLHLMTHLAGHLLGNLKTGAHRVLITWSQHMWPGGELPVSGSSPGVGSLRTRRVGDNMVDEGMADIRSMKVLYEK